MTVWSVHCAIFHYEKHRGHFSFIETVGNILNLFYFFTFLLFLQNMFSNSYDFNEGSYHTKCIIYIFLSVHNTQTRPFLRLTVTGLLK